MRVTVLAAAAAPPAAEPSCYSSVRNEWWCWQYVVDRREEITEAGVQHVGITLAAIVLAVALAFPLALLARRTRRLESTVLAVSTGLYTIPSLALFPLFLPFTGLSAATVVLALALYALTVLVRSLLDGLRAVPEEVRESAIGQGVGPTRLLLRVELPLALPVFLGGLRVAAVSTVALTTVGALVSYGGLGNLIQHGVARNFRAELLTASVLCVLLALVLDAVIVLLQRLLTPWTRGSTV
ncbi:ABC transporter permease [Nocardioides deserti]|uniref:ABC transporter permease n=1 Tax=Nocardioides deserti TaxID=1588644 RepID=A0ABR6UAU0_9ACTN|nr:ABC transporter permease [Nocardioides deserti]GGO78369.1 glycine/betaine ABC transporter permease [Nocardioides deserti]